MRNVTRRSIVVPTLILVLAALLPALLGGAAQAGPTTNLSNGITFDHAVYTDATRMVGEPDIAIDYKGGTYVSGPGGSTTQASWFWKANGNDNGVQWHSIGVLPEVKSNGQNGGGDTEIAIARNNDVFSSDLQTLQCNSIQRSTDEGNTFTTGEGCFPETDRQWMGVYDPTSTATNRRVYLSANGTANGCYFLVSTDNGLTYVPADPVPADLAAIDPANGRGCEGRMAVQPTAGPGGTPAGTIYSPMDDGTVFRSINGGVTFQNVGTTGAPGGAFFASLFLDSANNLYKSRITSESGNGSSNKVMLDYSTNGGVTWTSEQVNTGPASPVGTSPDLRKNLFVWGVAGDPGRVAVSWYGTTDSTYSTSGPTVGGTNSVWHIYTSFSTDALSATPHWTQVQSDEHPFHVGGICTGGFPGCLTANADRSLADFFMIDKDPRDGRVYIAYNENGDLSQVVPTEFIGKPIVGVIRLRTGPSLFAGQGTLKPVLPQGAGGGLANVAVSTATGAPGTLTVTGTQGLPPGNYTTDKSADAMFPVVPAAGPNQPALDITEASVSENGANLVFKMKVTDLTPAAQAQAATALGTPSYVFQWWSPTGSPTGNPPATCPGGTLTAIKCQSHFFVRWHGGASGTPFDYGRVGSIDAPALGAPTPKFLTYTPSGSGTATVTGNEVSMSVPLASVGATPSGQKIDHIHTWTWADHGAAFPSIVDAAKTFAYVIGTPVAQSHTSDGYVEVSLGNTFSSPILATLNNANNTWTASIPAVPASGQVCARQILGKTLYTSLWDDVQLGGNACLNFGSTALPSLSVNDVSHNEGNAGPTPYTFTVTISPALTGVQTASVHIVSSDGSATSPSDYTSVPDTVLSFDAANQTRTVTVNVNGDTTVEPDEQFSMILINPIGAQISDGQGTGTIVNDDSGGLQCTQTGTDGPDTLQGTPGDDVLCGLGGNDNIFGKGGNDTLLGGDDNDVLSGGQGADSLYGEDGNDTLTPGLGDDPVVDGGLGENSVTYGDAASAVTVDLVNQTATGGGGTDSLSGIVNATGSKYDDHLIGDGQVNILDGGTAGIDLIDAGDGNDVLVGGSGTDTLNGGAGVDSAKYTTSPAGVTVDLGAGTASNDGYGTADTLSSIEDAQGSNVGGDSITGSSVKNKLYGNGGTDQLFGLGANDLLYGGAGADAMDGGANTDTCDGGADTDTATNCESTPNVP